jgi:hypothetical protein
MKLGNFFWEVGNFKFYDKVAASKFRRNNRF